MVGVPGKYKGCETCRARRVKCDNQRPHCKKCTDSGRQCAGYERETVFIIGTINDFGRCSSHPPRALTTNKKDKGKRLEERIEEDTLKLIPVEPLQPAWDDLISVANFGKTYKVQIAALHTTLQMVVREKDNTRPSRFNIRSLPTYEPSDVQPFRAQGDFQLRSQCTVHLAQDNGVDAMETDGTDSICLFLYEHNHSVMASNLPPWKDPLVQANAVRRSGPESFRTFPNHHFFVRVYRHSAICAALLNRKPSFLAGPEWVTTPWEVHPKSFFDLLYDVIVLLPSIFARADHIFSQDPTLQRRLMAQDLLTNCLKVEKQLDEWHNSVTQDVVDSNSNEGSDPYPGPDSDDDNEGDTQPSVYWLEDDSSQPTNDTAQIPFADTFGFRDAVTATMFIHYWTALILFYPCVERLHTVVFQPIFQPVIADSFFPPVAMPSPPSAVPAHLLVVDPRRYGTAEVRDLAASLCRSLDFALNATVQPDLLVVPLFVVREFYRAVNESAGDGQLELMWCDGFGERLATKGQDIADVIRAKTWQDVSEY